MTLDRILPAGTEDYAGDEFMEELKAEIEALWTFAAVPLDSVAGTNTITGSARVEVAAYADGMGFLLVPANSNTGAATLNIDGVGAKAVIDYKGDAIAAGALSIGRRYELRYFAADDAFVVMTGPGGLATVETKSIVVSNTQTNGTAGGGATSGAWQTYTLNTTVLNELSGEGVSLSSNTIQALAAGTYDVWAAVPFNLTSHSRLRLYNVTDSAVIDLAATTVRATTASEIKAAILVGRFTLVAAKDLRLEYRVTTTRAADGLGTAASFSETEKYGLLMISRPSAGGLDGADGADGVDGSAGLQQNFDSSTADADPGDGAFRFDNATISSATQIFADDLEVGGGNVAGWLAGWAAFGAAIKGQLIVKGVDDPTDFAVFNVTGVTAASGYSKIAVTYVDHSGAFTAGQAYALQFSPAGTTGAAGAAGSSNVVGTSTTSLAIGTGTKTFTIAESARGWAIGARLRASSDASPAANWMEGVVASYAANTLQLSVDLVGGSGTHADWTINLAGEPGEDGANGADGTNGSNGTNGTNGTDGITPSRKWNFDSSTADADPGNGALRLNHATPSSVTEIYVDNQDAAGNAATAWLDALGGGTTENHKGYISLFKVANPAIFAQYVLTAAPVDGTGYRKLTVSFVEAAGTFTAADSLAFDFSRTGNSGVGTGDFSGPASSTNNNLVKFGDTTGKLGADSGVAVSTDGTFASDSDAKLPTEKAVKTYADTKAPINNAVFTGTTTLAGDPASALQAATKQYVDGLLTNLGKRARVRAATTANITIGTALNNGDALDGVTLAAGDQVLVKNQTAPEENGVYVVGVSPARAAEFDTYNEHSGSLIGVAEGSTNADTLWLCTSNDGGTLNTTAITFTKMVIAGELLAANNLSDVASASTARDNLGLGTANSPQFTGIEVGHATDTTLARLSAGDLSVEGNRIFRVGGADVPIADGGTGAGDAASAFANLKQVASTAATGVTELATAAEYRNKTAGNFALTPEQVFDAMAEVTLTDGATVTPDWDTGFDFVLTLGGNRTFANGSNLKVGKKGRLRIVQDGTGSRTISWGTDYEFAAATAPVLTTTASAQDILYYDCLATGRVLITLGGKAFS